MWSCPQCRRRFTRPHQRHACGTGDSDVLRGRPESLRILYASLESFVRTLGPVELVTRERYVLMRSTRIFVDLTVMADVLRVVVHLPRRVDDPVFFKIGADRNKVSHVAKVADAKALAAIKPYLREAYAFSVRQAAAR